MMLAFGTAGLFVLRGVGCGVALHGGGSLILFVRCSFPGGFSTPILKILPSLALMSFAGGF